MKYLILSLMVFGSFQVFSEDCNILNYKDFIYNEKASEDLINKTHKGCNFSDIGHKVDLAMLFGASLGMTQLGITYLMDPLTAADLTVGDLNGTRISWDDLTRGYSIWSDLTEAYLSGEDYLIGSLSGEDDLNGAYLIGATFPKKYKHMLTEEQQEQVLQFVD